jgi:XTP/dITP diphosphohydrolase
MSKLYFATSNRNKLREARKILGLRIRQLRMKIVEPQLWSINAVSREKAKQAYAAVRKPVFVEDTAIYIRGLKGFPGPFIYWVRKTVGNKGLLKLMKGVKDRRAEAKAVITHYNGRAFKQFVGSVKGRIAQRERGGGWGFDPIFIPQGYRKTYGELGEKKNEVSHRARAFKKFKAWLQK